MKLAKFLALTIVIYLQFDWQIVAKEGDVKGNLGKIVDEPETGLELQRVSRSADHLHGANRLKRSPCRPPWCQPPPSPRFRYAPRFQPAGAPRRGRPSGRIFGRRSWRSDDDYYDDYVDTAYHRKEGEYHGLHPLGDLPCYWGPPCKGINADCPPIDWDDCCGIQLVSRQCTTFPSFCRLAYTLHYLFVVWGQCLSTHCWVRPPGKP